ncbi:MAG: ribonuclease P protein component [Candidatus Pacebacteria bacterium]|nr:ribonuclease P protein component [Candidatus Paceibacterota bacterium]
MLKKKNRITSSVTFKEIFTKGNVKENECFKIIFKKNDLDYPRYGIIVSAKNSKSAVQRNALKRRIRNILRSSLLVFSRGFDVVIITKKGCLNINFSKLKESLDELLLKLFE